MIWKVAVGVIMVVASRRVATRNASLLMGTLTEGHSRLLRAALGSPDPRGTNRHGGITSNWMNDAKDTRPVSTIPTTGESTPISYSDYYAGLPTDGSYAESVCE